MREILFRGKRVDNGEWVYSSFIMQDKEHKLLLLAEVELFDGEMWRAIDPETVGQFTGLYDKKGTRIFEGDIIMPTVPSNIPPYEVVFDVTEGQFVVKDACGGHHGTLANYGRITDNRYKVVGNKWDNPSFLEVEE